MSARVGHRLLDRSLSLGASQHGSTQGGEDVRVALVVGGGLICLEALGELIAVLDDVMDRAGHHHLKNFSRTRIACTTTAPVAACTTPSRRQVSLADRPTRRPRPAVSL